MKRTAGALVMMAALGGCVTTGGQDTGTTFGGGGNAGVGGGCGAGCGAVHGGPPTVPGVQGAWGQPVAMKAPYTATPVGGEAAARAMMAQSVPLDMIQRAGFSAPAGAGSSVVQASAMMPPMPGAPGMMQAGMPPMPGGPGGPGGGVKPFGAVAAIGALTGGQSSPFQAQRSSVRFVGPSGMKISWYTPGGNDPKSNFSTTPIEVPGRYNFVQAAIYRLKMTEIANRPGLELYPTLEVVPANARTATFLAHSAIPVAFTEEDFDQVASGNFVVKVIYLPDPQFQDLATVGPNEVVSSRLEPGVDPIAEAHRRGSILLVVRLGNIDLEAPNTPAMDAPSPYQLKPPAPPAGGHGMAPGQMAPGRMGPNGFMPGNPTMLPNPMMVPGQSGRPTLPTLPPPPQGAGGTPVGKLPETSAVQPVMYRNPSAAQTPAALASQPYSGAAQK